MDIQNIKKLRKETGVSIAEIKKALEDSNNDVAKAKKLLRTRGIQRAKSKQGRETKEGIVSSYIHTTGKVGALVSLSCETDFVARTDEFKHLAREIAMQVAAMNPKNAPELLKQAYIRNPNITIGELIKEKIAKFGENITISAFTRHSI